MNNMFHYAPLFLDENEALNFALSHGLLYNMMQCDACQKQMIIVKDSSHRIGIAWQCPCCHKKTSVLLHSIFGYAKLPFNKILHLLYCWAHNYSNKLAQFEVGVNKNTVTFYYKQFRNACFECVMNQAHMIGGEGQTVEIDETLIAKRKYHVGRTLSQIWIFGGICR